MTAGRGIVHSEMPKVTEGNLWGFQLWINLPKKDKMVKPRYNFNTKKTKWSSPGTNSTQQRQIGQTHVQIQHKSDKMVKPRYKFNIQETEWSSLGINSREIHAVV